MTARYFHDSTETTPNTGDVLIHDSDTVHIARPALTAERLRQLISYDPETGRITRAGTDTPWGSLDPAGYWQVRLDGRNYRGHRLAWLYVHGEWPTKMIDHINGDRGDNRIANLRDVPQSYNAQNVRKQRRSRSGLRGATWHARTKAWRSVIFANGKQHYLGMYATPEEAHDAYNRARAVMHPGAVL